MRRIENQHPDDRDLAKRTLLWISQGKRLLSVAEMQQAVAIELGESDLDPDSTVDCDDIISACTGLVTKGRTSSGCEILRLVHYTTQDYLERTTAKYFPKSEEYLASSCLTYLLFDVFSVVLCPCLQDGSRSDNSDPFGPGKLINFYCFGCKKCWNAEQHEAEHESPKPGFRLANLFDRPCNYLRRKQYPFYAYAAWYWGNHAENCDDEAIRILTERFLNDHKRVSGALHFVREDDTVLDRPVAFKLEDSNPGSAMQLAAFLGLTKIMFERLENGSEPDVKDWCGETPLYLAAYQGHEDVVRLLMTRENVNPNVKGHYGKTPLMVAVQKRHIAIVQRLLAFEYIEINAKNGSGASALIYAIQLLRYGTQISKLLLTCDNIDVNLKDEQGETPLMWAVICEQGETVRLLLAHGDIQANIRNEKGQTALHLAARRKATEAMQLLLAHGDIQVNVRDKEGRTALHNAAEKHWTQGMRLLLSQEDIQVNIRDYQGSTALHVAIERWELQWELELLDAPKIDVAELFLARGDVDVNTRDMDGYSPLYHAVHSGEPNVVRLLLTREDLEISLEDGELGRLVSVAENLRDKLCEGKRIDAYNAIIILLHSYFQQKSSNTTSANFRQRIPERFAHPNNDDNDHDDNDDDNNDYDDDEEGEEYSGDAVQRTDNVEVIEEQILDFAGGESP